MRIVYFTHSLLSCWNHGNAHFLRGILRELRARGHDVRSYEPADGWSRTNLLLDPKGNAALQRFAVEFPDLAAVAHTMPASLEAALDGTQLVIVHEWNDPALVAAIGSMRRRGASFLLLFHDTHHRMVTDPDAMRHFDLDGYDAVLAFGESLARIYRSAGWGQRVFVWHEAADTRLFHPPKAATDRQGVVWIGNWGDEERSQELRDFLLSPIRDLHLPLDIYGVRYPASALRDIAAVGGIYRGWLPNARVPSMFANHAMTVHVPRRAYASALPGIPTIRVFEALACGIPLICAPWQDTEGLFRPGVDYLVADTPGIMRDHIHRLTIEPSFATEIAQRGLETLSARHTCSIRVEELVEIVQSLGLTL